MKRGNRIDGAKTTFATKTIASYKHILFTFWLSASKCVHTTNFSDKTKTHMCNWPTHREKKNDRKMRLRNSCVRFSVKNAKRKIITKPNTRSNQLIDGLIVHWTAVFIGECDRK